MDVLINLIVVIILQSIHVSNHHIAHNIICQLYLNKAGEKTFNTVGYPCAPLYC